MTRKTKKKRSPAMAYAVRIEGINGLSGFHYYFIDFKNRIAFNIAGNAIAIGKELYKNRFWSLNNGMWKWINKHEAVKVRIGGLQYVKDTYGLRS